MIGHRASAIHSKDYTDAETLALVVHGVAERYQRLALEDVQKLQECLCELQRLSALAGDFPERTQLINCSKVAIVLARQIMNALSSADPRALTPSVSSVG